MTLEDLEKETERLPVTPSKRSSTQSPVRRSKRREAISDEDSLERAECLVAIKNLEVPAICGNEFNNSIVSISDSVFSSNINSIGISMGENENEIFSSVSNIKCGEFDRLQANPSNKNSDEAYLDASDEEENFEIDNITIDHLCSGLIEEPKDEDADHIGSDRQTVSRKNGSKKKVIARPAIKISKKVSS